MQVILIQDVNNLGGANELVTVKAGYGRNYLIPQKFAIEANPSTLKQLEEKGKGVKAFDYYSSEAARLNAEKYLECSALKQTGLQDVFDEAIRAALKYKQEAQPQLKPEKSGCCIIL